MGVTRTSDIFSSEESIFTRSQSSPYDTNRCFFCERAALYHNQLHKVAKQNACLKNEIEIGGDKKMSVKICTAIQSK